MKKNSKTKPEKDEILNEQPEQQQETTDSNDENCNCDEALKQKCEELNDKNLRLMAEFDNFRKRSLKERMDLIKTASEKVLADMLPLVDDFERALQAMDTAEDVVAVKEGVNLIYGKFMSFLQQNGVKVIATENETFDVECHEAVTTFPAPSDDLKGKIIDCVSKGYTLNDKVIRFPKVVVGE